MTPKITRQKTLLIRPQTVEHEENVSSRLNFVPEAVPSVSFILRVFLENFHRTLRAMKTTGPNENT